MKYTLLGLAAMSLMSLSLNADYIDVTDSPYSATGNGTTDDRAAIQAAIDASNASSTAAEIYFPAGTYRVNVTTNGYIWYGLRNTNSKDLKIRGAGEGKTKIVFHCGATSSDLFWCNFTNETYNLTMSDITLSTNGSGSQSALRVVYPNPSSSHEHPGLLANRVQIMGEGSNNWKRAGFKLEYAWNSRIVDCTIANPANASRTGSAIYFVYPSMNSSIRGTNVYNFESGIKFEVLSGTDNFEGVMVSDSTFVDVKYGVYYPADTGNFLYWFAMDNSHVDARGTGSRAISIGDSSSVQVRGCMFHGDDSDISISGHFLHSVFSGNVFQGGGISLENSPNTSAYNTISNNVFAGVGDAPAEPGPTVAMPSIKLAYQTYRNVVTGNTFQNCNDKYTNGYQEPSPIQELNTNRVIYKQIIANNIWEPIADY